MLHPKMDYADPKTVPRAAKDSDAAPCSLQVPEPSLMADPHPCLKEHNILEIAILPNLQMHALGMPASYFGT